MLLEHEFERLATVLGLLDIVEAEFVQRPNETEPHGATVIHHQHRGPLQWGCRWR